MFTGIVQELGTVETVRRAGGLVRLDIRAPQTSRGLAVGESVAVNGVCLSVVRSRAGWLTFEAIVETAWLTNLGALKAGARVNLERSLTLSDRLNGHLVLGHVDGQGQVMRRHDAAGQVSLDVRIERRWSPYLVSKGSVAVDGVSLTVGARPSPTMMRLFLIPETLRNTTLGARRAGDAVNVELDYLAKLILHARTMTR